MKSYFILKVSGQMSQTQNVQSDLPKRPIFVSQNIPIIFSVYLIKQTLYCKHTG